MMTLLEVGYLLGMHPATVGGWCERNGLPFTVAGKQGTKHINEDALMTFLQEKRPELFRKLTEKEPQDNTNNRVPRRKKTTVTITTVTIEEME